MSTSCKLPTKKLTPADFSEPSPLFPSLMVLLSEIDPRNYSSRVDWMGYVLSDLCAQLVFTNTFPAQSSVIYQYIWRHRFCQPKYWSHTPGGSICIAAFPNFWRKTDSSSCSTICKFRVGFLSSNFRHERRCVGDRLDYFGQTLPSTFIAIFVCPTYSLLAAFGESGYKGLFAVPPGKHGDDLHYYFPEYVPFVEVFRSSS